MISSSDTPIKLLGLFITLWHARNSHETKKKTLWTKIIKKKSMGKKTLTSEHKHQFDHCDWSWWFHSEQTLEEHPTLVWKEKWINRKNIGDYQLVISGELYKNRLFCDKRKIPKREKYTFSSFSSILPIFVQKSWPIFQSLSAPCRKVKKPNKR